MTRVHLFITGEVQGVFFRAFLKEKADYLGLAGWAKNLFDGRVEAVFEGPKDKIRKMTYWCWQGSPASKIELVEEIKEKEEGLRDFEIKY